MLNIVKRKVLKKINNILTDICNIKNVRVYISVKGQDRSLLFKIKDIKNLTISRYKYKI